MRSGQYRPLFKWWFWILAVDFVVLMWVGAMPAGDLSLYRAGGCGLLVRLFPRDPAAAGHHQPLPMPQTIEEDFNAHYGHETHHHR